MDLCVHHLAFSALLRLDTIPHAIPPEAFLSHPGSAGYPKMTQFMSSLFAGLFIVYRWPTTKRYLSAWA